MASDGVCAYERQVNSHISQSLRDQHSLRKRSDRQGRRLRLLDDVVAASGTIAGGISGQKCRTSWHGHCTESNIIAAGAGSGKSEPGPRREPQANVSQHAECRRQRDQEASCLSDGESVQIVLVQDLLPIRVALLALLYTFT